VKCLRLGMEIEKEERYKVIKLRVKGGTIKSWLIENIEKNDRFNEKIMFNNT
jgi:hypothetical protein